LSSFASDVGTQTPSRVVVGFLAGLNHSAFDFSEADVLSSTGKVGMSAGLAVRLPRNRYSYLRAGLEVQTSGGEFSQIGRYITPDGQRLPARSSVDLTYLTLPLAIGLSPLSHANRPHFDFGLELAHLLSSRLAIRVGPNPGTYVFRDGSSFNDWELGAVVTAGADLPIGRRRAFSEVAYRQGISPTWRSSWSNSVDGTYRAFELRLGFWL
jgi:hypothetical protein